MTKAENLPENGMVPCFDEIAGPRFINGTCMAQHFHEKLLYFECGCCGKTDRPGVVIENEGERGACWYFVICMPCLAIVNAAISITATIGRSNCPGDPSIEPPPF